MKIKIWTLTTDTQESGFQQQAFATEQERDAAAWSKILALFDEGGFAEEERPDPSASSIYDEWDFVRQDDTDSLYRDSCEIELPSTTKTVWALATSNDGQMDIQHFDSEADLNAEILGQIQDALEDDFDELLKAAEGDVQEAYTLAQEHHEFSTDMHWTSHEVELPAPAGVNAELLAAAKAMVDANTEFTRERAKGALSAAIAAAEAGQVETPAEPTQEQMDEFPIEDWRYDASNGDTRRGYNEWVIENAAQAAEMQEG